MVKPNRECGIRVRVNVSGRRFESYQSTLVSKEGSIFGYSSIMKYYDEQNQEFFFDKDPHAFEAILVYLQCGILKQPDKVAFKTFIEDLQFFGFGGKAFELYEKESFKGSMMTTSNYGTRKEVGTRVYLYNIFEHPDINFTAQLLATFTSLIIFVSIVAYCVESLPSMDDEDKQILNGVEAFCVCWFTIELVTRFVLCPDKVAFVKSIMNLIDLVAIFPFYMSLAMGDNEANDNVVGIAMLRVLRVVRVFRVFKLSRYSKAIYLIILTISTSIRELLLLLMFILILMVLFAAGIYHFEQDYLDDTNKFKSIPHTFWIVIVTITTVGYGDMYPITTGKMIATYFSMKKTTI